MKASLRSKILVLSLASLVVIGTGCERRGRAPVKSAPTTEQQKPGEVNTLTEEEKEIAKLKEITPVQPKGELITSRETTVEEDALVASAKLGNDCKIAISANEKATDASFAKDYQSLMKLKACMSANGVATKGRSIDRAALSAEFDKLTKELPQGNHELSKFTLNSRARLFTLYADRIATKYAASASSTTKFEAGSAQSSDVREIGVSMKEISEDSVGMKNVIAEVTKIAEDAKVSQPEESKDSADDKTID